MYTITINIHKKIHSFIQWYKIEPEEYEKIMKKETAKEAANFIWSIHTNNDRHPVTKTFTLLH